MVIPGGYLLFLGASTDVLETKTACGLVDWRPEDCVGQWRLPGGSVDLGLPDLDPARARTAGARTMVIGAAPFGGRIEPAWTTAIVEALRAGLDVASGMHTPLASVPAIAEAADRTGRALYDVRVADQAYPVGSGRKRSGLRLLTVGTDCAVGKKYTALAIHRALRERGLKATFRATGQTGILIAGGGVPIDAIVSDFVAGAAESLSPDNDASHWDVIEGQGSLFHPAYAAVTLGLIHGSQPDALVICSAAGRTHVDGYPLYPLPSLEQCMETTVAMARLTNPAARCVGVSLNTATLPKVERERVLGEAAIRCGVPAFDPVLTGVDVLADRLAGDAL